MSQLLSPYSDNKHDELMNVVSGFLATKKQMIFPILARLPKFGDGANMLNDLHFSKKLQKVATDMVSPIVPI